MLECNLKMCEMARKVQLLEVRLVIHNFDMEKFRDWSRVLNYFYKVTGIAISSSI